MEHFSLSKQLAQSRTPSENPFRGVNQVSGPSSRGPEVGSRLVPVLAARARGLRRRQQHDSERTIDLIMSLTAPDSWEGLDPGTIDITENF